MYTNIDVTSYIALFVLDPRRDPGSSGSGPISLFGRCGAVFRSYFASMSYTIVPLTVQRFSASFSRRSVLDGSGRALSRHTELRVDVQKVAEIFNFDFRVPECAR